MGLDLNSFGAGFFGQAVKDRDANKEEERLARRQAMLNKLQEESAIRTAQRKTTAGTPYKVGDKYYVQDTDGDGNIKGPAREARPDEVRAYEDGDLDRRTKTASTKTSEFQAKNLEADRNMIIAEREQRMFLDREQNAREGAAEKRYASQDKEAKAAAKKAGKDEEKAIAVASQVVGVLNTIPKDGTWTPRATALKKLYDEVNLTTALGRAGQLPNWHNKLQRLLVQARALAGQKDGESSGEPAASLDPFKKDPNK